MADHLLAMPLTDALRRLCEAHVAVTVVPVTPPAGARVRRWRVARVKRAAGGSLEVATVGEIEGTIACDVRLEQT